MPSTYGVGRTAAYDIKTVFHGFNRAVTIRTERGGYLYNNVAERISARRATHGFIAKWIPALENVTERRECFFFVECYGADIRSSRGKSRVVTERISAATKCHGAVRCGLIELLRKKSLCGYILTPCISFPEKWSTIYQYQGITWLLRCLRGRNI